MRVRVRVCVCLFYLKDGGGEASESEVQRQRGAAGAGATAGGETGGADAQHTTKSKYTPQSPRQSLATTLGTPAQHNLIRC